MIYADKYLPGYGSTLNPSAIYCNVREGPCANPPRTCDCPGPHFTPEKGTERVVLDAWPVDEEARARVEYEKVIQAELRAMAEERLKARGWPPGR